MLKHMWHPWQRLCSRTVQVLHRPASSPFENVTYIMDKKEKTVEQLESCNRQFCFPRSPAAGLHHSHVYRLLLKGKEMLNSGKHGHAERSLRHSVCKFMLPQGETDQRLDITRIKRWNDRNPKPRLLCLQYQHFGVIIAFTARCPEPRCTPLPTNTSSFTITDQNGWKSKIITSASPLIVTVVGPPARASSPPGWKRMRTLWRWWKLLMIHLPSPRADGELEQCLWIYCSLLICGLSLPIRIRLSVSTRIDYRCSRSCGAQQKNYKNRY